MLTIPCSENYVHLCNESDNTLSVCLTVLHVTATNVQHEAGILTLGVCVCVCVCVGGGGYYVYSDDKVQGGLPTHTDTGPSWVALFYHSLVLCTL